MDAAERPSAPPVTESTGIPAAGDAPAPAAPAPPASEPPPSRPAGDLPTESVGLRPPPAAPSQQGPSTEPAGVPPADVPSFLRGWRRYLVVSRLGAGGMGEVYRAWDPQLRRWVALKFLHGSDPLRLARFQREAQAQARVDHPGVCRVYEVGEVEGRPYIAMQEIVGDTLNRTARELPLEERVRLVAQVADAVHAAHRIGLIHRDLKPGNILVAWGEDGLHPYVVDFGLARDQHISGLTVSGSLSGTPGYMAPEQASGHETALDRRADIYSLGAVLYELIAGRLPLPAGNLAEAIVRLLQEEPEPLRRLVPALPVDLETVVMKCLEKDPARRYESSRAFAADLRRWLDGEPVEARPAGAVYRLRKRLQRHPRVVVASAAALAIIVALGAFALRTHWEAAARAEAARRFGAAAKEMESLIRVGALSPAHDTRGERGAVRMAMAHVETEMAGLGEEARGAGLYALGRGALALGRSGEALARLDAAWEAGERGPEVSYALGQALALGYFEGLEQLTPGQLAEADAPLQRELERRFRDPARRHLRRAAAARSSLDAPELVEAWLALDEGRYAAAREAAERALRGRPWLYEARQVQGRAWRREGTAADDRGALDDALALYARARTANEAAMAIARSSAAAHGEQCALGQAVLRVVRQRRPLMAAEVAGAVAECDRAVALDPDLAWAHGERGRLLTVAAEDGLRGGVDPGPLVRQAIAALARQVSLDPSADDGWVNAGTAHLVLARWQLLHGDPRPELERSIAAFRRAVRLDPRRATTYNGLGNALLTLARFLDTRGLPSEQPRRQAIVAYERALALWGGFATAYGNMGQAWVDVANRELGMGRDPRPSLRRGIDAFARGLAHNSSNPAYFNNNGNAHTALGEYLMSRGEEPHDVFAAATQYFHRALELRPEYAIPQWNLAYVARLEALWQLRHGEDPGDSLAAAHAALAEARRLDPADADNALEGARQQLLSARWAAGQGRSPLPALERAGSEVAAGLALNAESADLHLAAAERWRWTAQWQRAHRADAAAAIARGLGEAKRALVLHPDLAEALAQRAALLRLAGDEEGAAAALSAARKANPLVAVEER